MSYVSVLPATLATAATEVARIGSALSLASAVAAAQTSAVQAAAADEVSAAIAALFSAHGRDFQALSARAAAFHHEFVQAWPRVRGPMRSPRLPPHRRCRA